MRWFRPCIPGTELNEPLDPADHSSSRQNSLRKSCSRPRSLTNLASPAPIVRLVFPSNFGLPPLLGGWVSLCGRSHINWILRDLPVDVLLLRQSNPKHNLNSTPPPSIGSPQPVVCCIYFPLIVHVFLLHPLRAPKKPQKSQQSSLSGFAVNSQRQKRIITKIDLNGLQHWSNFAAIQP